jgi:hypothetical protein
MLRQEWKMCIYCIILMTWVSGHLNQRGQQVANSGSSTTTPIPARTATPLSCSPRSILQTPLPRVLPFS